MFRSLFEIYCGFREIYFQSIPELLCAITYMPLLERDGLGFRVYLNPGDLDTRRSDAAAGVREMPGTFESIRQPVNPRFHACITVG